MISGIHWNTATFLFEKKTSVPLSSTLFPRHEAQVLDPCKQTASCHAAVMLQPRRLQVADWNLFLLSGVKENAANIRPSQLQPFWMISPSESTSWRCSWMNKWRGRGRTTIQSIQWWRDGSWKERARALHKAWIAGITLFLIHTIQYGNKTLTELLDQTNT